MPMSLAGLPLVDPQSLKRDCDRMGISTDKWWGRANSFVCPLHDFEGRMYGLGWALIWSRTYQQLPADANEMDWVWTDPFGRTITLKKICLLNTEAVKWADFGGVVTEYMITLVDRRYRLDQVAVSREYNTRGPDGEYITASLNSGSAWTWATCVQNLWDKMRAVFSDLSGTAPQFPSTPPGDPEGFYFYDDGAWTCLWRVVEAAGFLLRYDPTTDAFDIVDPDTSTPVAIPADEQGRFIASNIPYQAKSPPWPETLRVTFPIMGTNARSSVDVTVGEGGEAGTVECVADDLPDVGTNAASLSDRADAILRVWKWSEKARWDNAFQQVQGVSTWCRRTLGYFYRTDWMIQDLSNEKVGGGVVTTSSSTGWWKSRPGLSLAGTDESGSGSGRFIQYLYRDDCVDGILYRFRAELYQSYVNGMVTSTDWEFELLNGCCECAGSGTGEITPGSAPCPDGYAYQVATISDTTGDCGCLPATLIFGGGGSWGTATCPGNVNWILTCEGGFYVLRVGGVLATPVGYSPGVIVFDTPNLGANCGGAGGTARVTFTP